MLHICATPAELRSCRDHRPAKPGNVLPGSLQENSAQPALELAYSKRGLWTSSLGFAWEAVRNGNLGLYPRPTDSESSDPRWVLLTLKFEKLWFRGPCSGHPLVAPSPRCRQLERTRGYIHLETRPPRPCSEHLNPRIPAPSTNAGLLPSWGPSPSPPGGQDTAVYGVGRGWPELGREGCLSSRFLTAQSGSEGGKSRGRAGGWGSALSAVRPSGLELQSPEIPACRVVTKVHLTIC